MSTSSYIRWLIVLCFFVIHQNAMGQETIRFKYGKNGGKAKFHGKLQIQCKLKSKKLKNNELIDFNTSIGSVMTVEFSNLEVGLTKDLKDKKNTEHKDRFYMQIFSATKIPKPRGETDVEISPKDSRAGKKSNRINYNISGMAMSKNIVLRFNLKIVDRHSGNVSLVRKIKRTFPVIPSKKSEERIFWNPIEASWVAIQEDPNGENIAEEKAALLEKLGQYLRDCEEEVFSGRYREDALFYSINITKGKQQREYIDKYSREYRRGQYKDEIEEILDNQVEEAQAAAPVEAGARLDYDDNYVIINGVRGGQMPYWVQFFDDNKQDSLAIDDSYSFSKDYEHIDLELINVPEGSYTIVITDSNGSEFVSEDGVYISKALKMHPSVKTGIALILLGSLIFAYKKYFHS